MATDIIRDLAIRLGLVGAPATKKQLREVDREVERLKQGMEDAASWALRAGVAVATFAVGAATALGALTIQTGQHATEVERQARLLNLSRKEYQEWLFVTESFGGTASDLADSFLQINEASQRALDGSTEMVANFRMLGIGTAELRNKNPSQLFDLLAERLATTADRGKAMAAVSRLLGEEAARKLGPALLSGADAVKQLRLEATELGVVMNDDQLRVTKAVATQWTRLKAVARGLRNEIGAALAPMVERYLRGLMGWVKANRQLISSRIEAWVERLRVSIDLLNAAVRVIGGWDNVLMAVATGAGVLTLLANLGRIEAAVGAIGAALKVLRALAATAGIAIGAPFIPVAVIIAGLAGALFLLGLVVDDVVTHFRGGQSVLGGWLEIIDGIIPAFGVWRDMWWAVATAVGTGFVELGRFASALVKGLAPALQVVDMAIQPVLLALQTLLGLWLQLNAIAMRPMQAATTWLNSQTAASDNNSRIVASQLQASVASSVQGQVNALRMPPTTGGGQTNVTQNQGISFHGFGISRGDVEQALASENRRAAVALQGGRR